MEPAACLGSRRAPYGNAFAAAGSLRTEPAKAEVQARNEQPHNPESSAVLSTGARITERGPSCTSHSPPPLAAWERANAGKEGRRSAVLGGEGDPPKSSSLGPSPFLVSGETLGSQPPSFAGVLGERASPPEEGRFLC